MFEALRKRLRNEEDGFTLIELMVVVLIIAILIAIAIPTFLGARSRAQDRAAQSDLRNSLVAAETYYTDTESYDATAAQLLAIEPELDFDDTDLSGAGVNDILVVSNANDVTFVRESSSGTFFCIAKSETAGTTYNSGATAAAVDTLAECNAASW